MFTIGPENNDIEKSLMKPNTASDPYTVNIPANLAPIAPHDLLPEGIDSTTVTNPWTGRQGLARKGTVGAVLNNIVRLNNLVQSNNPDNEAIRSLINSIQELIPALNCIGMFDLFRVEDWLIDQLQPGKQLVALLYLQHYPEQVCDNIREKLLTLNKNKYLQTEIKKIK